MKTQNTHKLNFTKESIVELNDYDISNINGGHPTFALSSAPCGAAIGSLFTAILDWATGD